MPFNIIAYSRNIMSRNHVRRAKAHYQLKYTSFLLFLLCS